MDVFELVRRFRELEDKVASLQQQINNLERNKTDKITYPYIPPSYTWPQYPNQQPAMSPTITCSTGEKV